jgi:hypothetical protein
LRQAPKKENRNGSAEMKSDHDTSWYIKQPQGQTKQEYKLKQTILDFDINNYATNTDGREQVSVSRGALFRKSFTDMNMKNEEKRKFAVLRQKHSENYQRNN